MVVDTSRWSHLADFVGHSIGALSCNDVFLCTAVFISNLNYGRNIRTLIMLTMGITNVICWSPNYSITLCI